MADAAAGEKSADGSYDSSDSSNASAVADAAARATTFRRERGVADDKLARCVPTCTISRRAMRAGSLFATVLPHSSHGTSIVDPFFCIFRRQYRPLRVKRPSATRQPELAVFFRRGPLGVAVSALDASPASLY